MTVPATAGGGPARTAAERANQNHQSEARADWEWWRNWRTLPPKAPYADCQATDPDFSWQGQWPVPGYWKPITDPQSGRSFNVWERALRLSRNRPQVHTHLRWRDVRGPDA